MSEQEKTMETKEQRQDKESASASNFTRSFAAGFISGAVSKY